MNDCLNAVLCLLSSVLRDQGCLFVLYFCFCFCFLYCNSLLRGKNKDSQLTSSSSVKGTELNYLIAHEVLSFKNKGVFLSLWLVSRYKKGN